MLRQFASERGITFPLLSDEGSAFIRQIGIVNESFAADQRAFGTPFPGTFVVDASGRITSKIFHESNYVRNASATAMRETLGIDLSEGPSSEWHDDLMLVRASLDSDVFVRQRRVGWRLAVALADGLHVYGPDVADGFVPLRVTLHVPEGVIIDGPLYPPAAQRTFPFAAGAIAVYDGAFEVTGGVTFADIREDATIEIAIQYQACDDRECFAPATASLSLPIRYEPFP